MSRRYLGRAVLGALLLLGAYLIYLLPYQDLPGWIDRLGQLTARLGWYGPVGFGLATAVLVAIGVPRLLMTGVAAAMFGIWLGLSCTLLGSLLGVYATFIAVRWGGREAGLARWPKLRKFTGLLSRPGIVPVLLCRQLPLSSFFINVLLGLTTVRTRDFLVGSLIGFLPAAIPTALIGAGLVQGELAATLKYLMVGAVLFISLGLLARRLLRSAGQQALAEIGPPLPNDAGSEGGNR